jgi:hypothetical protein
MLSIKRYAQYRLLITRLIGAAHKSDKAVTTLFKVRKHVKRYDSLPELDRLNACTDPFKYR